jgi:hypothetical protein
LFPATTTAAAAAVLVEADEYELTKRDDDEGVKEVVNEAMDDGRVRSSSSSPSLL